MTRGIPESGEVRDVTIIGAGPVGLSTAFWCGMREASCRIVESLAEVGGQCTTLYPEKWIFDVPGFPRVTANELIERLREQALEPFDVPVHLETTASAVTYEPDSEDPERQLIRLQTDRGDSLSRALIVAGGHGAFEPKRMPGLDLTRYEARGVHYLVTEKDAFAGKRVVIAGGGDSACDWTLNLLGLAEEVTLVHRREEFRAHESTVKQLRNAEARGACRILTPYEIVDAAGEDCLERVWLTGPASDGSDRFDLEADALLVQFGFKTALGALKDWPLEIERGAIKVDPLMKTSMRGVWACGDITTFDGKLKLIATGFAEAAVAVAQAIHFIRPGTRIQPKYSTNTGVPRAVVAGGV